MVTTKQQLHVASETVTVQAGLRMRCEYIMTGTEGIVGRWVETPSGQDKGAAVLMAGTNG